MFLMNVHMSTITAACQPLVSYEDRNTRVPTFKQESKWLHEDYPRWWNTYTFEDSTRWSIKCGCAMLAVSDELAIWDPMRIRGLHVRLAWNMDSTMSEENDHYEPLNPRMQWYRRQHLTETPKPYHQVSWMTPTRWEIVWYDMKHTKCWLCCDQTLAWKKWRLWTRNWTHCIPR